MHRHGREAQRAVAAAQWCFVGVVQCGAAVLGGVALLEGARATAIAVLCLALGLTVMMFGPGTGAPRPRVDGSTRRMVE